MPAAVAARPPGDGTVTEPPPLWVRLLIAAGVAAVAVVLADHPLSDDFAQVWMAARVMLGGGDPYTLVGPGLLHDSPYPLYYPETAGVAVLPLTPLPLHIARVSFAAGGAAAFVMMLTRDGLSKLPWLASYAFLSCLYVVQWTTWLAAAAVYPLLGFVASAKPNAGIAALASNPSRRSLLISLAGCAVVGLVSVAMDPGWPLRWFPMTRNVPHFRTLLFVHPAGVLLLASLLRWRRPEARALAALAVIPHNPLPHNLLLLSVGRWTVAESAMLSVLSWCVVPIVWPGGRQSADFAALSIVSGRASLFLLYLPALALLLRKPNSA